MIWLHYALMVIWEFQELQLNNITGMKMTVCTTAKMDARPVTLIGTSALIAIKDSSGMMISLAYLQ